MTGSETNDGSGLAAVLALAEPVIVGLPVLAVLRVINRGAAAVAVSARLNLMEGDVALDIDEPGGGTRKIAGWQADTALRRIELPPDTQLVGAMTLLETPQGPVFPAPGSYQVVASYRPSPRLPEVVAPPVEAAARGPSSEEERRLAELMADPALRRAVLLGDAAGVAETSLGELAAGFPLSFAGRLARLLSAGAGDQPGGQGVAQDQALADALAILALRSPFNDSGARLAEDYAARRQASRADAADSLALRLVRSQPVAIAAVGI